MGKIYRHIYDITRKSREWSWTETEEAAISYLKNAVRTFDTLAPANEDSK